MARMNVYLPDALAVAARAAGLNISSVTQEAVTRALAARSTDAWLATLRPAVSPHIPHDSVLRALDETREGPLTCHG